MTNVPNWQKHSSKPRKGRGACKGQMKAAKQRLLALKRKLNLAR